MTAQTIADSADNASAEGSADWQQELREAYRNVDELLQFLGLPMDLVECRASKDFPFLVTRSFAQRMRHADAEDPLLRQVLPVAEELHNGEGYSTDPLDEVAAIQCQGVLQKYQSRALLVATPACAIHCRYCFRRHFDYQAPTQKWWHDARNELSQNQDLEEVILSGGDPLMLSNEMLAQMITDIEAMPQIQRLRIHTRLPIVLPTRIDSALLFLLQRTRLDVVVVVHCNHAQEIDESVIHACHQLRDSGILVLNQSVLLRGVNDASSVLADLSRALISCGVLPYYLHAVDHVASVAHFMVSDSHARKIMQELQARVSGYMLPRFVREIPGEIAKTILTY